MQRKGDEYTIPKVKYTYEKVSWETFMNNNYNGYKTIRSSFIPYIMINDESYWILGSFVDFPNDILTDFGGSCIVYDPPIKYLRKHEKQTRNYQHSFGCAMLELNEESKGLLVKPVLKSLPRDDTLIYRGVDRQRKEYVWFVFVNVDYEEAKLAIANFDRAPDVVIEKFGPINFYRGKDVIEGKHRTSRNLTDFIFSLK